VFRQELRHCRFQVATGTAPKKVASLANNQESCCQGLRSVDVFELMRDCELVSCACFSDFGKVWGQAYRIWSSTPGNPYDPEAFTPRQLSHAFQQLCNLIQLCENMGSTVQDLQRYRVTPRRSDLGTGLMHSANCVQNESEGTITSCRVSLLCLC
jgi:hypothetical protein